MINLPNVHLFGIDSHDPEGLLRAAEICQRGIKFGAVTMITDDLFTKGGTAAKRREDYSRFCIQDMAKHIKKSHALIIHPDGFIQNPKAWDNSWLEYDYIGAPWVFYKEHMVGNGGFSLRSKRLLDILARTELTNFHPEDSVICRDLRPWLEKKFNIRFAPVEVAKLFSIEGYGVDPNLNRYDGEFGFHGHHVRGLPIPVKKPVKFGAPYVKQRR